MNVEKVKKFSVENAGRIANVAFDIAMDAKAAVETGTLLEAYSEFQE